MGLSVSSLQYSPPPKTVEFTWPYCLVLQSCRFSTISLSPRRTQVVTSSVAGSSSSIQKDTRPPPHHLFITTTMIDQQCPYIKLSFKIKTTNMYLKHSSLICCTTVLYLNLKFKKHIIVQYTLYPAGPKFPFLQLLYEELCTLQYILQQYVLHIIATVCPCTWSHHFNTQLFVIESLVHQESSPPLLL